jgi:N-acetylmuramoyl-L-alanine amidase
MFKFVVVLWLCVLSTAQAAINVTAAQLTTGKKFTRLVLESQHPIAHSTFNISQPERLVIDLNEVNITPMLEKLRTKIGRYDPLIDSLRIAYFQHKTTRLVFELKHPVRPQVLAIGPMKRNVYRLTFDFYPADNEPVAREERPLSQSTRPSWQAESDQLIVIQPRNHNEPITIQGNSRNEPLIIRPIPRNDELIVIPPTRNSGERDAPLIIKPSTNITFEPAQNTESTIRPHLTASNHLRTPITFFNDPSPVYHAPAQLKMSPFMDNPPRTKSKRLRGGKSPKLRSSPQLQRLPAQSRADTPAPFVATSFFEEAIPASTTAENTNPPTTGRNTITIALDAGHGGEDPGALGYYGSNEKNVTLAIARQVQILLAQTANLRGVLTRTGDFYIPLAERVNKAHQANADLFVSIHADAFINSTARGSSVYTLSKHGASSTAASWLANKENGADLIGGTNVLGKDPFLMRTLFDLSQTAAVKDSQKLASQVLKELGGINNLHRGKVEQAGFAVLKSPRIPSILIETAFISNPEEENRLNDIGYQTRIARAIVRGIQRYFAQNPAVTRDKFARKDES